MWRVLIISSLAGIIGTGLGGVVGLIFGKRSNAAVSFILSFAGGVMLSIVFFDLVPAALEISSVLITSLAIVAGVVVVWLLNRLIDMLTNSRKTHETAQELYHQDAIFSDAQRGSMIKSGIVMFAAIALHNFPEGLAIGSSDAHSESMGLMLGILIAIHNIPEGISIAVPLLEGGMGKGRVILLTALAGAPTLLGGAVGALIGTAGDAVVGFALALAGGAMLYVTFCEILPQVVLLNKSRTPAIFAVLGVLFGFIMVQVLA